LDFKTNYEKIEKRGGNQEMSKKAVKVGILAAIGGVIAGILLAPKSGKETRADIKREAKKAGEKGKKVADKAKVEGKKVVAKGKKEGKKAAKRAENTYQGAKKGFQKKI
jgi:gas vesicle protein